MFALLLKAIFFVFTRYYSSDTVTPFLHNIMDFCKKPFNSFFSIYWGIIVECIDFIQKL